MDIFTKSDGEGNKSEMFLDILNGTFQRLCALHIMECWYRYIEKHLCTVIMCMYKNNMSSKLQYLLCELNTYYVSCSYNINHHYCQLDATLLFVSKPVSCTQASSAVYQQHKTDMRSKLHPGRPANCVTNTYHPG